MCKTILSTVMTFFFAAIVSAQSGSIESSGQKRTFLVHVPTGLPENPPLVLSMHGLGGSGSQQQSMSGFNAIADKEKFIVVYPDGTYKFSGSNGWDTQGKTDTDFLAALIDTMIARYKVDPKRVYAGGFSMGGMVSYCLACAHPGKLAAIGPCAGYNPCSPKAPVSIIHIHGTKDQAVAYSGLANIINKWVSFNGCPATAQVTQPYPASNSASKTKKEYWGPCSKEGTEIVVLSVEGMDHAWPSANMGTKDIVASQEYWAFFKTHPKGGSTGISQPVAGTGMKQPVSARCHAGKIHLKSGEEIRSVRVNDIQGRSLFAWNAGSDAVNAIAFPMKRYAAGGIYVINVMDVTGRKVLSVVAP